MASKLKLLAYFVNDLSFVSLCEALVSFNPVLSNSSLEGGETLMT